MKNLKIRSSSLGKIMTNPRSKTSGELSQTCKTYIQELFLENQYGIVKEFWSRYTDKGNAVEMDSIHLANDVLNWGLKFEEIQLQDENTFQRKFENDYLTGHADVCNDSLLSDVKSSFDGTTFPFFAEKIPNKDYMYQLMGYMYLSGHEQAQLTYCLVNTPEQMVLDEIRREHWKMNSAWQGDENEQIVAYVRSKHDFSHIPKEVRVKNFIIERDEEIIDKIKSRVEQCREYYAELSKNHLHI
jgi:hypothetical protein